MKAGDKVYAACIDTGYHGQPDKVVVIEAVLKSVSATGVVVTDRRPGAFGYRVRIPINDSCLATTPEEALRRLGAQLGNDIERFDQLASQAADHVTLVQAEIGRRQKKSTGEG